MTGVEQILWGDVLEGVSWLAAIVALAGTAYRIIAARLLERMMARPVLEPAAHPPVSLLKPLCGVEPGLEDNLRSFCRQAYPEYQIVFGVHDEDDPALPVVRRLCEEFPGRDIAIAIGGGRPSGGNPKISNLLDMMPMAKHEVLVISDSDTLVRPDHLTALVATLERPEVGIATCLYVGRPTGSLWSRLGAMGINHGFVPSVAVAEAVGRKDGCYGAGIALRRGTLERVGGFGRFQELLADDYFLGAAVRQTGLEIAVAPSWPQCCVHETGFRSLMAQEIRWGRTLFSIERVGYVASGITYNLFWAFLAVLADPGQMALTVLGVAFLGRLWAIRNEERILRVKSEPVWLVALRDLLSMAVHIAAVAGQDVSWRNQRLRLGPNGTLHPMESPDY